MKRILSMAIISLVLMVASECVYAQTIGTNRFGVFGGYVSSKTSSASDAWTPGNASLWTAGLAYQVQLEYGLAVQPEISWTAKGAQFTNSLDQKLNLSTGYLEGGVQLQWGADLLLFRPYVLVEPYLGYALSVKERLGESVCKDFDTAGLKRFEWGMGAGLGVEFWQLQLAFKWFWNIGGLYNPDSATAATSVGLATSGALENAKAYKGFMVSLYIFLM
ncbi:MAG: PorT family protein [Bacteroidales bacterium]|nr:PorT family protein [Bacteroidales bacterium]